MEQDVERHSAEKTGAFRKGVLRRMQGSADHQGNSAVVPRIVDTARPLFGRTLPKTKRVEALTLRLNLRQFWTVSLVSITVLPARNSLAESTQSGRIRHQTQSCESQRGSVRSARLLTGCAAPCVQPRRTVSL